MASTKFIKAIGDEELVKMVFDAVKAEGDEFMEGEVVRSDGTCERGNPYNVYVTFKTRFDGEDEDSTLTDTYEVDDYDVTPFDWGGAEDVIRCKVAWRKGLFDRYGTEYAVYHLFGALEESMTPRDASDWLIED